MEVEEAPALTGRDNRRAVRRDAVEEERKVDLRDVVAGAPKAVRRDVVPKGRRAGLQVVGRLDVDLHCFRGENCLRGCVAEPVDCLGRHLRGAELSCQE